MKRKILAVILAVLMLISLCGCVFRDAEAPVQTDTLYYGYNNLNAVEQSIYNEILEGAKNLETTFDLFDADEKDIERVYRTLVHDHPELFWLSDGYKYSLSNFSLLGLVDFNFLKLTANSLQVDQELELKITELDKKVNEIIEKANTYKTQYEKVLFVYDYIVENTVYDYETADKLDTEEAKTTIYPAQTAYGCLVEGNAICSGYSEAFQLILQKMGILCGNAFGKDKEEGVAHQWNFALLDGEYYFFDVTWGDTQNQDGTATDYKSYEYFGITTEQLKLTHILDENKLAPECLGEKNNYYKQSGMFAGAYSFATTKEIIKKQLNNNQISVMYATAQECEKAKKDLFDRYKFFNITSKYDEVYYYTGVSGCLLIIKE